MKIELKVKWSILAIACLAVFIISAQAALPVIVATDNADNTTYGPQLNDHWATNNGGYGYNLWTPIGGAGGTYMEGIGPRNEHQVEGNYSFGIYAGNGTYAISRPLTTPIAGPGEFDIIERFDLAGYGPNLFSIRSGNGTGSFGSGELLSFGIVSSNQLSYTDGSGFHTLSSGESRGVVWAWNITFNASSGTYSALVTNLGGGFAASFSGNLEASNSTVGSFAALNSSTGSIQNMIFDMPTFSIPIPVVPVKIFAPALTGSNFGLSFTSVLNQSYTIWGNTNLTTTNWVAQTNVMGNGFTNRVLLPVGSNIWQRFYRVTVGP